MDQQIPEWKAEAFNCPYCSAYAHMDWRPLMDRTGLAGFAMSVCAKCDVGAVWQIKTTRMIFPDSTSAPRPALNMPEDVKIDYMEAADIFSRSPRAAAALLRLALQKLCVHLGEKGEKIDVDIRELAKKHVLPQMLIKVADTVRLTGNNAVHPGEMSSEDVDHVASKMFFMLNLIVQKGITEPLELEALYQLTPENPRKAAEEKDAKNRSKV